MERVRALMRGVALYSAQVAALYDSPLSEGRKVSELARYIARRDITVPIGTPAT